MKTPTIKVLNAILRTDFHAFVQKVFETVSPNATYLDNWHIKLICSEISDMLTGKNRRLIINIPPRYMKSIICSVALPAFILGHNPKATVICVSYSDDLSLKFANDCRNVMESDWYKDMFPGTRISKSRRSVADFETTKNGGRLSTSVGGTLTGRGADFIVIDDPIKPTDAMSDIIREKVNQWFQSTLCSRLNDKKLGCILLIMQRLHENDMTGFLLNSDMGFKLLRLPVVAEEDEHWEIKRPFSNKILCITRAPGDLLHPDRDGEQEILELRKTMGELAFACQYQQRPAPLVGNLIHKDWIHYYNELPDKMDRIFLSWDTASKVSANNAFSACSVIGIKNQKLYLLQIYRERLEFPALCRKIAELHEEYKTKYPSALITTLIEDASSGPSLAQQLRYEHGDMKVTLVKPDTDKITRLESVSSYIENGLILFPSVAPNWWQDFSSELFTFPNTTFKDQCDAFSQCLHVAAPIATKPAPRVFVL